MKGDITHTPSELTEGTLACGKTGSQTQKTRLHSIYSTTGEPPFGVT
jgi:hypothetical protein